MLLPDVDLGRILKVATRTIERRKKLLPRLHLLYRDVTGERQRWGLEFEWVLD